MVKVMHMKDVRETVPNERNGCKQLDGGNGSIFRAIVEAFASVFFCMLFAFSAHGATLRFSSSNSAVANGIWITTKAHLPLDGATIDENPYIVTSFRQGCSQEGIPYVCFCVETDDETVLLDSSLKLTFTIDTVHGVFKDELLYNGKSSRRMRGHLGLNAPMNFAPGQYTVKVTASSNRHLSASKTVSFRITPAGERIEETLDAIMQNGGSSVSSELISFSTSSSSPWFSDTSTGFVASGCVGKNESSLLTMTAKKPVAYMFVAGVFGLNKTKGSATLSWNVNEEELDWCSAEDIVDESKWWSQYGELFGVGVLLNGDSTCWKYEDGVSDLKLTEVGFGRLTALSVRRMVNVSFNSNGGGAVDSMVAIVGEQYRSLEDLYWDYWGDVLIGNRPRYFVDVDIDKCGYFPSAPNPPRAGMQFLGWYNSAGEQVTESSVVPRNATDHTLTARWSNMSSIMYTVTFNANGGTVSPTSKTVEKDTAVGALPTPEWNGHAFKGWWTSASGGAQVTASTIVMGDVTYYAHWDKKDPKECTVTFNANGGTVSPTSKTVEKDTAVGALPTPVWNGHAFKGWWTESNGGQQVSSNTIIVKDMTVYAHWIIQGQAQTYTVVFHRRHTVNDTLTKPISFRVGSSVSLPKLGEGLGWAPRGGYKFLGWANAEDSSVVKYADGATVPSLSWTVGATVHLYGVWDVAPGYYAIKFNRNDGSGEWRTVAFPHGKTKALPSCANGLGWSRAGYAFVGWSLSAAKANATGTPANIWKPDQAQVAAPVAAGEVLEVYASWVKGYVIRYHKNTGESPEPIRTQGINSNVKARLLSVKNGLGWTRTGFTFRGWATSKANAAAGKIWKGDYAYVTNGAAAGKTLDVWAVWDVAPGYYAIKFNRNDGSGEWRTVAFPHGRTKALPSCAKGLGWSRTGYAFVGWAISTAKAANPVVSNVWKADQCTVEKPIAAGQMLDVYAVWVKGYTIRFHKNDGTSAVKSQGFVANAKARIPALKNGLNWSRSGYVFKGWATSKAKADAGTVWKVDWAYVTNAAAQGKVLNVYAIWKKGSSGPSNDNFSNATVLSGTSGSATGTNAGATLEANEPIVKAYAYAAHSVWWTWTAPNSGTVAFSTSGSSFDTVMGVYTGSSVAGLSAVVENDDCKAGDGSSLCQFSVKGGTVYRIAVAGYDSSQSGTIKLTWGYDSNKSIANGPGISFLQMASADGDVVDMAETQVYTGVLEDGLGVYQLMISGANLDGGRVGRFCIETEEATSVAACVVIETSEGFLLELESGGLVLVSREGTAVRL